MNSRKKRLYDALFTALTPDTLIVENESYQHQVPKNAETHFKVIAVSNVFNGKRLIQRHRIINELLSDEFSSGLHALSLHLYTPSEYATQSGQIPSSPACQRKRKESH